MTRGKLVVVEGPDFSGKGVFIQCMIGFLREQGAVVFDIQQYWLKHRHHPTVEEVKATGATYLVLGEPTYILVGSVIREELIADSGTKYSAAAIAEAYALDRHILIEQIEAPARDAGIHVIKDRSAVSSVIYQAYQAAQSAEPVDRNYILRLPGNALALSHAQAATHLLIVTVPTEVLVERGKSRLKQDRCRYENAPFLRGIIPLYESSEIRVLCEQAGTQVGYIRLDGDELSTKKRAEQYAREVFHL